MTTSTERTLEYTLDLDATPEEVWKAIATGEGLMSWFAYDARVTPGSTDSQGSVYLSWGDWGGESPITIWEPNHRLQTTEHRAPYGAEGMAPVDITVDYFIEARAGGTTRLRLVHAGIGPEKEWDGEYHATAEDWPWFLVNLAHYLVEHGGEVRDVISLVARCEFPASELWNRILDGAASAAKLGEGQPYDLRLFGREAARGVVKMLKPGRRFMGTIDQLNRAMAVFTVYDQKDKSKVAIELSTFGLDESQRNDAKSSWVSALQNLGATVDGETNDA